MAFRFFFVVGGLVTGADGDNTIQGAWLVLKKCTVLQSHYTTQIPDPNKNPIISITTCNFQSIASGERTHFVNLTPSVRKVGYYHNCSSTNSTARCTFNHDLKTVTHSENTMDGGHFLLVPRCSGYPPRRS